jgi:capsular exopolysaccharide synthesis family protein
MGPSEPRRSESADWLRPPAEEPALQRYLTTLRERIWMILLAVVVTTGAAVLYLVLAHDRYEAHADVLVTPVTSTDRTLSGLVVIRASSDPTRDVETAARLITARDVAQRVNDRLHLNTSPESLLAKVSAVPVAQSNIVTITATDSTPGGAKELANAFGGEAIRKRTQKFHDQVKEQIRGLTARLGGASADSSTLRRLDALLTAPDPTMRLETLAAKPGSAAWPKPKLTIAVAIFAGLVLGISAAFASQALDPRLRREDQLRGLFRLPILTRIPKERGRTSSPLSPRDLTPAAAEAYRTLRGTLAASRARRDGPQSVLITGASPSEGKTTAAVNLAASLALGGSRVVLIEADLRRPAMRQVFDVESERGVVSVLIGEASLSSALVTTERYGPNLQVLLADSTGGWTPELLSLPAGKRLLDDAKRMADYVVVDSPPLSEVIDALELAQRVDDVIIVVRLGKSHINKIVRLGELLADNGIRPVGFAMVGTSRPGRGEGYYYRARAGGLSGDASATGPDREPIGTETQPE